MRLFAESKGSRGSIAWTNALRLKIAVFPPAPAETQSPQPAPAAQEYDEDGRLWVFRYPQSAPQHYAIDRERIFEYRKRHTLPGESVRTIRRDVRNCADFYTDVREIQTHPEIVSDSV